MSGSGNGGVTSQGVHSGTGGSPLVVVQNPCGGNQLPLPPTLYEDLDYEQRRRLNMIQLEYARDVALLESRAYDALLKALVPPRDE